jgi:hypothetical protein
MNTGLNPSKTPVRSHVTCFATVVGAGGSAPTVPTTTPENNLASSVVRTSEGLYVVTLRDCPQRIITADVNIKTAANVYGKVSTWSESAKTITFRTFEADGSIIDVTTSETCTIVIDGQESIA